MVVPRPSALDKLNRTAVFGGVIIFLIALAFLPANAEQRQKPQPPAKPAPAAAKPAPAKANTAPAAKETVDCHTCHDVGDKTPAGGSRHPALDIGCESCHAPHDESATPDPKSPKHLKKAAPALCLDCHNVKEASLVKAHQGQPFAQANCLSCHAPHVSENAKLLHKFAHPPFAGGTCDSCHQAPKGNKVVLIEGGNKALCFTCHSDIQERVEKSKVKHGLFQVSDSCTECHSPHASPHPAHLKQAQISLCESCHAEREQEHKTEKFLHKPAFQDGCAICHEPHGSNHPAHLRAEGNELCLTCHAQEARGEKGSDDKTLTLFGGAVKLPGNYLNQVKRVALSSAGKGHPVANHPARGVPDPSNKGKQISCTTCHDPHASKGSPALFVTQKRSSSALCVRCHD